MPDYLAIGKTPSAGLLVDIVTAADPGAAEQTFLQRYGVGLSTDRAVVVYGLVALSTSGTVTPNANPADATLQSNGNTATQAQIIQAAQTALSNNQTFLGIASPTNAQAVAQIQALTRQVDGLIRFLVGNFSGTS